jgi:hypothetical protein
MIPGQTWPCEESGAVADDSWHVRSGWLQDCRYAVAVFSEYETTTIQFKIKKTDVFMRPGEVSVDCGITLERGYNIIVICRDNWRQMIEIEIGHEGEGRVFHCRDNAVIMYTRGTYRAVGYPLHGYASPPIVLILGRGVMSLQSMCRLTLGEELIDEVRNRRQLPINLFNSCYFFLRGVYVSERARRSSPFPPV